MFYESILRPLLFRLDPEFAHEAGCRFLRMIAKFSPARNLIRFCSLREKDPVELFGLKFPNRIGQAAGLDKDALFPRASEALGFGHVEVGTVTPDAQPGNEKPRLFRLPEELALVNRMGFNNDGVRSLAKRVAADFPKSVRRIPLGINLGKGKSTPLEQALGDYQVGFDQVAEYADYVTINISSPNTPDLRLLHQAEFLDPLLKGIALHRLEWSKSHGHASPPCLLKISPDESFKSIELIIEKVMAYGFDGVIACNTSVRSRSFLRNPPAQSGGISGKPLDQRSFEVIKFISNLTEQRVPIIGSGGIFDYESAQRKLDAGAVLLQIYTSFVYNGPGWPARLAKRLPLAKSWH